MREQKGGLIGEKALARRLPLRSALGAATHAPLSLQGLAGAHYSCAPLVSWRCE
jgi:hypothetical protein